MGNLTTLLLLMLVLCHGVAITMGFFRDDDDDDWGMEFERRGGSPSGFLMHNSKRVVKTEAGEMRVLRSYGGRSLERRMHIGFINMEPRSLFIPQYLDSDLVIFIRRGEAKLGYIHKDALAERRLKSGDVYVIPAGSPFYLVNTGEGQRLHTICSISHSEGSGFGTFHSFYIGGGANPASVLLGFEPVILETAFNATRRDLQKIFTELDGPIVYVGDSHSPSLWTKFLQMKNEDKVQHMRKMVQDQEEHDGQEQEQTSWSWRKILNTVFGKENKKSDYKGTADSPDSYNLYDRKPDFRNNYGQSTALDGDEYHPLRDVGVGVYHVNLTAGSMMAPHINPRATEYGIVLRGSGRVQIVYPNGSSAMNAEVQEGEVFFVPRFFPFCQIASRSGPLEFFGFTNSATKNAPQFLAGAASLVRTMMGPELAAGFGVSEDTMRRVADAQREAVILPSTWAAPGDVEKEEKRERERVHVEEPRTMERDASVKDFAKDLVVDVVDV